MISAVLRVNEKENAILVTLAAKYRAELLLSPNTAPEFFEEMKYTDRLLVKLSGNKRRFK